MPQRTTLILLAAGAVVALVWFLQPDPPKNQRTLFADWSTSSAVRVVVRHVDSPAFTVERNKLGVWMLTDAVPPLRAKQLLLAQLLQSLREVSALRTVAEHAGEADLERYGLHSGMSSAVTATAADGTVVSLSMGAALGTGGVAARTNRSDAVVAVPSEILPLLLPDRADCVDPQLLALNPLDVTSIRFHRAGVLAFSLERRFSRWVIGSQGDAPADAGQCDRMRNMLATVCSVLRHTPSEATSALWTAAALNSQMVELQERSGVVRSIEFRLAPSGELLARTPEDACVHQVATEVKLVLALDASQLRDRRVVLAESGDIVAVTVKNAGATTEWKLARTGTLWDVVLPAREASANLAQPSTVLLPADALARSKFIERLASLQYDAGSVQRTTASAANPVVVTIASGERADRIQTLAFAGDSSGSVVMDDRESACSGSIAAASLDFLRATPLDLLERLAIGAGAYFAIGGIRLRMEGEEEVEIRTTIPAPGEDLQGALVTAQGPRPIPEEVIRPVVHRLVVPTVKRFVGCGSAPEHGFERPLVDAAFYELTKPDADQVDPNGDGRWRSLRIGAPCGSEGFYARFDGDPADLVFILEQQDLAVFSNLLRFARQ